MNADTLSQNSTQGKTSLLDSFALNQRSSIANQFFNAYRSGAETPKAILLAVKADALRRTLTDEGERRDAQKLLLSLLESDDAKVFAEQVIARERLSPEDKSRLRKERSEHFRREYMKAQCPTAPQLELLQKRGCKVRPANRLEATDLIEATR